MKESLDFIYKEQRELSTLGGIAALLGWDQMTYMPSMGVEERAKQSALISRLSHERVVSGNLWNHIQKCKKEKLKKKDRNVVYRLEKDVEKARKIPSDFVERMAKTITIAYQSWERARNKNDFKIFSSDLKKIVDLEKEYADYIKLPGPKYNSLLDDYEEGMTVDILKKEFSYLKNELIKILEKIINSKHYNNKLSNIKFNVDAQKKICKIVLEKMKLPLDRSRIDISTHPFTTSMGNDDVRITTNYVRENPLFSFFSTVHEAGHALYELGKLKEEYKDTVISDSPSLGMHESQSRFWENMIARNRYFWKYFYPIFEKTLPYQFKNINLEKWYKIVNQVRPSLIRVEADELTYCLHVILRFEIEIELMDDKIQVENLVEIWNEKMDQMLGIIPKNDKEGVLQDMHWSGGSFGYFPTYAIGSIYSAQLFSELIKQKLNTITEIENGQFDNIIGWLRENVHQYGRLMSADEIIKKTCGEGLNSKKFVDYLKEKYFLLYEV